MRKNMLAFTRDSTTKLQAQRHAPSVVPALSQLPLTVSCGIGICRSPLSAPLGASLIIVRLQRSVSSPWHQICICFAFSLCLSLIYCESVNLPLAGVEQFLIWPHNHSAIFKSSRYEKGLPFSRPCHSVMFHDVCFLANWIFVPVDIYT